MKRQSYYPSRFADQIPWHENLRTKLPGYIVTLGLDAGKTATVVAASRFIIYVLSQWLAAARAFGPASTQAVDLTLSGTGTDPVVLPTFTAPDLPAGVTPVAPGALNLIFDFIAEIKDADACTDVVCQDLGILGAADTANHPSPTIRMEVIAGAGASQNVRGNFVKFGHMAVYWESRRGNGPWEFLGIDTDSPYLDERPLLVANTPEVREYRARFWDHGTPNGEWTDVAKVTVAP